MMFYEHIILSQTGHVLHSTGWCERHWFSRGVSEYNGDRGPKRVKIHDTPDAELLCTECQDTPQITEGK